jgi:hypothetical protein
MRVKTTRLRLCMCARERNLLDSWIGIPFPLIGNGSTGQGAFGAARGHSVGGSAVASANARREGRQEALPGEGAGKGRPPGRACIGQDGSRVGLAGDTGGHAGGRAHRGKRPGLIADPWRGRIQPGSHTEIETVTATPPRQPGLNNRGVWLLVARPLCFASVLVRATDQNGCSTKLGFSGDLGNQRSPL